MDNGGESPYILQLTSSSFKTGSVSCQLWCRVDWSVCLQILTNVKPPSFSGMQSELSKLQSVSSLIQIHNIRQLEANADPPTVNIVNMDGLRHPPTLGQAHMVMSTTWVQRQDTSRLKQRVPLTERTVVIRQIAMTLSCSVLKLKHSSNLEQTVTLRSEYCYCWIIIDLVQGRDFC